MDKPLSIFWFRRDLRLHDNTALNAALASGATVLPIFIFDTEILSSLPADDARVSFIYEQLHELHTQLKSYESSLHIYQGKPCEVFEKLVKAYAPTAVYTNEDYEPYARNRDESVQALLAKDQVAFNSFKDQVVFAPHEVLKPDGTPYTVYTPYKKRWLARLTEQPVAVLSLPEVPSFFQTQEAFPTRKALGFKASTQSVRPYSLKNLDEYAKHRDFPATEGTSSLSVHLRFGTVSIRELVQQVAAFELFLSELVWREFFMQVLYHFPDSAFQNFKPKYNAIKWRNDTTEIAAWKQGKTGYPIVDAGMRELNATGYMHNRVRMVVASFLCKHLLVDWRIGEAYFAEKLLDFELAANVGNWQWSSGTGCDAAPYFRVFNPYEQTKKFDPQLQYIRRWVPELDSFDYPSPIVDHKFARQRALEAYAVIKG